VGLVVWYGLSASIFSFWLWMKGIRHVPGSLAGVFSAVLPVAAAAYGIAFLGERPTLAHGVALACVVTGIVLASLRVKRAERRGLIRPPRRRVAAAAPANALQ
jgi:drug/metabolite transporter (DMT)-like permease